MSNKLLYKTARVEAMCLVNGRGHSPRHSFHRSCWSLSCSPASTENVRNFMSTPTVGQTPLLRFVVDLSDDKSYNKSYNNLTCRDAVDLL